MENSKIESPEYLMDISENCVDNISQTSISPTISNQAENDSDEKNNDILETMSSNLNTLNLNKSDKKNFNEQNIENQNTLHISDQINSQKLTPVRNHPLMPSRSDSEESSYNNTNARNFPDVVLMTHNQAPLRLNQPSKISAITSSSTDLVNSVNNNDGRNHTPKYREPSPVSFLLSISLLKFLNLINVGYYNLILTVLNYMNS